LAGNGLTVGRLFQINTERALFGELSAPLIKDFRLDVGARLFRASVDDELESGGATVTHVERRTNLSPSASLSWSPDRRRIVYARIASAFRPSGLSPFVPVANASFDSDELQSAELGGRYASSDGRLNLGATAYLANWTHIQSDYLLPNGLIATRNSGTGRIYGIETRIKRSFGAFSLEGGLLLQHARLEKPEPGLSLPAENRLPIVPGVKGHLIARYAVPVRSGSFDLVGQFNHIGSTRLSLDPALNRYTAARQTLDLDARRNWNDWSLSLGATNVFNSHRNSFAFGNQFALSPLTQSTPIRPRTVSLSISRSWR
jgi:outer membrane receptor protein involved in Fe transport